jgi:transcription antitermination factor NusG
MCEEFTSGAGDSAWHAIHTRYQHEKLAEELLIEKGFETFLPLYHTVHRWKDRLRPLDLPLFPSYLFIRGGLDRRLAIVTTSGVQSIVGLGQQAGIVTLAEIEAIRTLIATRLALEPCPFLKLGDRVRVVQGPLAGVEGILLRKKNRCRLVLSVDLLQQSVSTEVDAWAVERVYAPMSYRRGTPVLHPSFAVVPTHAA